MEHENLGNDANGEGTSGVNHEGESTDALSRDGLPGSVRWAARCSGGLKSLWRPDEGRHIRTRG
jgi:hypothetical protein